MELYIFWFLIEMPEVFSNLLLVSCDERERGIVGPESSSP